MGILSLLVLYYNQQNVLRKNAGSNTLSSAKKVVEIENGRWIFRHEQKKNPGQHCGDHFMLTNILAYSQASIQRTLDCVRTTTSYLVDDAVFARIFSLLETPERPLPDFQGHSKCTGTTRLLPVCSLPSFSPPFLAQCSNPLEMQPTHQHTPERRQRRMGSTTSLMMSEMETQGLFDLSMPHFA